MVEAAIIRMQALLEAIMVSLCFNRAIDVCLLLKSLSVFQNIFESALSSTSKTVMQRFTT